MRTLRLVVLGSAGWLAACGRGGFDAVPEPDAAVDAGPVTLACKAPRFEIDASTKQLTAVATERGYGVLAVDASNEIRASAYELAADGSLAASVAAAVAPDATGKLAALAAGADLLIAKPYSLPAPGTALIPLDGALASRGTPVTHEGWLSGDRTLARNAKGTLALLSQNIASHEVDVQLVAADGSTAGSAMIQISPPGAIADSPTITPVGDKFLVAWTGPATSLPDAVHAQLLDDRLLDLTGAKQLTADPMHNAQLPRVAYAAAADRYLVAWYQKTVAGTDEVWISLRNGALDELGTRIQVATLGVAPSIAAGPDDFLVVWQSAGQDYKLAAARVSKDGDVTPVSVPGTGTVAAWDLISRNGQPALVWVEASGGLNLWIDPLCPP